MWVFGGVDEGMYTSTYKRQQSTVKVVADTLGRNHNDIRRGANQESQDNDEEVLGDGNLILLDAFIDTVVLRGVTRLLWCDGGCSSAASFHAISAQL